MVSTIKSLKEGQEINDLIVLERAGTTSNGHYLWSVRCYCGNVFITNGSDLKSGHTKSCGCSRVKSLDARNSKAKIRHSDDDNRLYRILVNMKTRCFNEKSYYFKSYGGRGITICQEWMDSSRSFMDWAKSNGYSSVLTIDRIDVNGNYEPGNCQWITTKAQSRNRRDTVYVIWMGESIALANLVDRESTVPLRTVRNRLNVLGWTLSRALSTPLRREG